MAAIGIVGGVGPMAGIDLAKKVFLHTKAKTDQEHINLFLVSCPSLIPDRTDYLIKGGSDPAPGMQKCFESLASSGATAVGISCNTAHSPKILGRVKLPQGVVLVNMIDSACAEIQRRYKSGKIGIIATLGTLGTGVYDQYMANYPAMELVKACAETQERVHKAIYDPSYGIKATPSVSNKASEEVKNAVRELKDKGCKAVILGCTELPLVFVQTPSFEGVDLIDPTEILAVELIKAVSPEKLI